MDSKLEKILLNTESLLRVNDSSRRGAVLCFKSNFHKIFVTREQIAKFPKLDSAGKYHLELIDTYRPENGEIVLIYCHNDKDGFIESMIVSTF